MFKHELGATAKSDITDLEGMITSRSEHLNGCNRYWLEPKIDKKTGNPREGRWVDEDELIIVKKTVMPRVKKDNGGFQSRIK